MKRLLLVGWVIGLAFFSVAQAQEKFSQTVRPEDFAAAGLGKLSAGERAKLDALIEAYGSGALVAAKREAAAAAEARVVAEAKAAEAEREVQTVKATAAKEKAAGGGGFFSKAKVMLKPGTEVEYERVETRLLGDFHGWEVGTVFALENGQRWQVVSGSYSMGREPGPRKVVIAPGVLGSFFLEVEGVRSKPKIKFVGETK